MNFESLDIAEKSRFPFFALRIPRVGWIARAAEATRRGNSPGFRISPFKGCGETETIPPQFSLEDIEVERAATSVAEDDCPQSTSRESHKESVRNAISDIGRIPELEKVVISRVEKIVRDFPLSEIIRKLDEAYPDAYIFCFRTPSCGLWAGASPELLLSSWEGRLYTMSLAGTRPRGENSPWSAKNIREQKIVTDYILSTLRQAGYAPTASGLSTHPAGPVEHLCTYISAPALSGMEDCIRIADILAPTPAVGGFPQHEALMSIKRNESHARGVYGGYAGIVSSHGDFTFFVTLRCMRIFSHSALLYLGGGITSESDPDDEWLETVAKSATLKSIVARCANSGE